MEPTPDRATPGRHSVALAGEFLVLAELYLRGLDAALLLGHTKEIDILVLNRATGRKVRLEVKTSTTGVRRSRVFQTTGYAWRMDERHGRVHAPDLVYGFVALDTRAERRRFFFVPSRDVASYIRWEFPYWVRHSTRRTGKVSPMRTLRIPVIDPPRAALPSSWRDGRWHRWENDWAIFGRLPTSR